MAAQSIACIAVNGDGSGAKRLLIARRLPTGDMGSRWEFPGGKVEAGETPPQALRREFQEEFSSDVAVGPHIATATFEHHGTKRELLAYAVTPAKSPADFVLTEHTETAWATIAAIKTLPFVDSDLKILPAVEAYVNSH
jgi:8-oxo-dGTP diphosphatase